MVGPVQTGNELPGASCCGKPAVVQSISRQAPPSQPAGGRNPILPPNCPVSIVYINSSALACAFPAAPRESGSQGVQPMQASRNRATLAGRPERLKIFF